MDYEDTIGGLYANYFGGIRMFWRIHLVLLRLIADLGKALKILELLGFWSSLPMVTRLGTREDVWFAFSSVVHKNTRIKSSRWDWQKALTMAEKTRRMAK
jgi:hypothetical protein